MKILLCIFTLSLLLNASIFTKEENKSGVLIEEFRQNVNDTNSIIWRGDYDKIPSHKASVSSITKKIQNLKIAQEKKQELTANLQNYAAIVDIIALNLQKEAPKLKSHYENSIANLDAFNKKISSVGLYALSSGWRELSSIKNSFVKKPNPTLEKKFDNMLSEIIVTITELYLDDEAESFLLGYLENYKLYFKEITAAYSKANFSKINELKPLSYKIKAELELL
ncbi:MAG: hypothetical protein PHX44_02935 [Sulfurimonas sp.]|uniref:hypothetical protein n=1 Tax=Sulfurimonas sp. TaxID=2022749 RepID=UPI00262C94F9|nr:hypothetical protein [Sulfurimonas sp.]MDD2651993.1 hypothetical protein [Sulfurimonas sp.]MDD3451881.1 hypothetical protein [Sulfurimonas sp.]